MLLRAEAKHLERIDSGSDRKEARTKPRKRKFVRKKRPKHAPPSDCDDRRSSSAESDAAGCYSAPADSETDVDVADLAAARRRRNRKRGEESAQKNRGRLRALRPTNARLRRGRAEPASKSEGEKGGRGAGARKERKGAKRERKSDSEKEGRKQREVRFAKPEEPSANVPERATGTEKTEKSTTDEAQPVQWKITQPYWEGVASMPGDSFDTLLLYDPPDFGEKKFEFDASKQAFVDETNTFQLGESSQSLAFKEPRVEDDDAPPPPQPPLTQPPPPAPLPPAKLPAKPPAPKTTATPAKIKPPAKQQVAFKPPARTNAPVKPPAVARTPPAAPHKPGLVAPPRAARARSASPQAKPTTRAVSPVRAFLDTMMQRFKTEKPPPPAPAQKARSSPQQKTRARNQPPAVTPRAPAAPKLPSQHSSAENEVVLKIIDYHLSLAEYADGVTQEATQPKLPVVPEVAVGAPVEPVGATKVVEQPEQVRAAAEVHQEVYETQRKPRKPKEASKKTEEGEQRQATQARHAIREIQR